MRWPGTCASWTPSAPPAVQPSRDELKDHVIPIVVALLAAGASFAAGRKRSGVKKAAAAPIDSG
jgi:hypothetical protein